jgi:hypothetical protein
LEKAGNRFSASVGNPDPGDHLPDIVLAAVTPAAIERRENAP